MTLMQGAPHWPTVMTFARRCGFLFILLLPGVACLAAERIDRRALVERHTLRYDGYTPEAPASLGNGEFAFSFDITGMQTFPGASPGDLPLATMAQWAWHTFPGSEAYKYADTLREYPVHGRMVSYATDMTSEAAQAIRSNPHRFNLARIGLRLIREDGATATVSDLTHATQIVSLWSGAATSRFELDGCPVLVRTAVHPTQDALAFSVESPLVASRRVAVEIRFPYPLGEWGPLLDDWEQTSRHTSDIEATDSGYRIRRRLDATEYAVNLSSRAELKRESPQTFVLSSSGERIRGVAHFVNTRLHSDRPITPAPLDFKQVAEASSKHWAGFWSTGGVIDLSGSSDPRWRELERRVVLSQFLTAIHCAGSMPPQETGLVCNSWFGKSHLEMHWWHSAHFPLWGRPALLLRSLGWYQDILPAAERIALRQGYAGARWPKMTGPHGLSSPSEVGELLIWQQPHPIYFAELAYRSDPTRETLDKFSRIVEETAEFMASYAHFDPRTERFVLGPVLIPAQECYEGRSPAGVLNPTFELAYWRWALQVANQWRLRRGLAANEEWAQVATKISRPTIRGGVYTAIQNALFTKRHDHPSMLAAFGVMPDVGLIDPETMRRTLTDVRHDWDWPSTWGWDYPMMAMTAARLGNGHAAIDYLLFDTPKNHYLVNGHCRQTDRLPVYLPANGGLLTAAAMMAAGWDGVDPSANAPGFPADGSWKVLHEGLSPMP